MNSNKNVNKKAIAIYYTSIILAIIAMIGVLVIVGTGWDERSTILRYDVGFYIFSLILPLGFLLRLYFENNTEKKKILKKGIVCLAEFIVGTLLIIFTFNMYVSLGLMLASITIYLYLVSPGKSK